MKFCHNCGSQLEDQATVCPRCGAAQSGSHPAYSEQSYDHTREFDPKDISDNKVICMLVYLMGTIGILIALLASQSSPYTAFHVRQALKLEVVTILTTLVTVLLCWTILVPILGAIVAVGILVLKVIAFFQICSGSAIEPWGVRSLNFLR